MDSTTHQEFAKKEGCCGGPAPAGIDACCAKDAAAKANGEAGCGCSTRADKAQKPPRSKDCCGSAA